MCKYKYIHINVHYEMSIIDCYCISKDVSVAGQSLLEKLTVEKYICEKSIKPSSEI